MARLKKVHSRKNASISDTVTNAGKMTDDSFRGTGMSKYEIIDCIMELNKSAKSEFLDQFTTDELDMYLEHLMEVDLEEVALCA
jgi:hypothetical protein